jgi:hypothetical protein
LINTNFLRLESRFDTFVINRLGAIAGERLLGIGHPCNLLLNPCLNHLGWGWLSYILAAERPESL